MTTWNEAKHYPEPDYPYCNAGHRLVEVYNAKNDRWEWDCPVCIRKMEDA